MHLLLVGGGHSHVEVLRRFARHKQPGLRITLVSKSERMLYSGMLPGVIRGDYTRAEASIELAPLARAAGAQLIVGEAIAIHLQLRRLAVAGAAPVPFDLLSLDVGGTQAVAEEHGLPVKPIEDFLGEWIRLEATLPLGARVIVAGAGAAGTELTLALARRCHPRLRFTLVSAQFGPVAEAPARGRQSVRIGLLEAGVSLVSGVSATHAADGRLFLSDGSYLDAEAVLWATGVTGPGFLSASGLACDEAGCVQVDACLRSVSHDFVFATGDCAALSDPRPKAGVWAVRAGAPLAENLRRAAANRPLRQWRPQRRAMTMVGLGDGQAVAWRNGIAASGRAIWVWKDWIDRRWIERYRIGGTAMDTPAQRMAGSRL